MQDDSDLFKLQHHLDDVLADAWDRAKLIQHIGDANGGNGGTFQGGQQDTAQGIAQGCAVAALKRADNEAAVIAGFCLAFHFRRYHVT